MDVLTQSVSDMLDNTFAELVADILTSCSDRLEVPGKKTNNEGSCWNQTFFKVVNRRWLPHKWLDKRLEGIEKITLSPFKIALFRYVSSYGGF